MRNLILRILEFRNRNLLILAYFFKSLYVHRKPVALLVVLEKESRIYEFVNIIINLGFFKLYS